jgi:hypothetical protein
MLVPEKYRFFVGSMHLLKSVQVKLPHKRLHLLMTEKARQHILDEGLSIFNLQVISRPANDILIAALLR